VSCARRSGQWAAGPAVGSMAAARQVPSRLAGEVAQPGELVAESGEGTRVPLPPWGRPPQLKSNGAHGELGILEIEERQRCLPIAQLHWGARFLLDRDPDASSVRSDGRWPRATKWGRTVAALRW